MSLFITTFLIIAAVIAMMAVGVMFGRGAITGSCGGINGGSCPCAEKCEKRKKYELAQGESR